MTSDLQSKLRRIEALRAENAEDAHPSFVRIEAAARLDDHLTAEETRERAVLCHVDFPSLGSVLVPAAVCFAFALSLFLAAASHDPRCVAMPWDGNVETLLTTLKC
jgi:hypothetical protein